MWATNVTPEGKWKASVNMEGCPAKEKTFATWIEADDWARRTEAEMKREILEKSCVSSGQYIGKILKIEQGRAVQKKGREPDIVVYHDISKLSEVPKVGVVADIRYINGRAVVKDCGQSKEIGR